MKKFSSSYWFKSAFFSILQRFSTTLFGVLNFVILIRHLFTKTQMGTWALFLIIVTIFETTKGALLKGAHIKYMSSNNDDNEKTMIASSSLVINGSISFVFIVFLFLFSNSLGIWFHTGPELYYMLISYIPGLVAMVFFSHLEATQQAHFDFKGVFAGYFSRQVIFFLCIGVHDFLKIPVSLAQVAFYQGISIVLGTLIMYIYTRRYLLNRFKFSMAWSKTLVNYGGYIFASGAVANIYLNLDQLMIGTYMLPKDVSIYNAATRINQFIDIPSYSAAEILFPKATKASSNEGNEKVKYLLERMIAVVLCFTIPAALFIIIFPKFVIMLVAGPAYFAAAPILQLYMLTGILRPVQSQSANVLNSIGRTGLCLILNCVYLSTNLVLNYFFIRYLHFYGAAIGTLVTFCIIIILWCYVMKKEIGFNVSNIYFYMVDFYKTSSNTVIGFFSKTKTAVK